MCFSRILSPEPLELQRIYLHLFASLSEELSDEKIIFEIRSQNQLIFSNPGLPEKRRLLETIRRFEKLKNFFFMDPRFRNYTHIQTIFRLKNPHATSASQARCVCSIFVNLIVISCHYNNDYSR